MTQKPKFLRSMCQWSALWWRVAPAQIALKQMTWTDALNHNNNILQMGEEARILGESPFKAVLYCSMLRSSIASRAQRRDGSLDVPKAFSEVDKTILKAVETRLSSVTQAVGFAQQKTPTAPAPAQQGTSGQDADMMAKQTLDAITKASKGDGRVARRE